MASEGDDASFYDGWVLDEDDPVALLNVELMENCGLEPDEDDRRRVDRICCQGEYQVSTYDVVETLMIWLCVFTKEEFEEFFHERDVDVVKRLFAMYRPFCNPKYRIYMHYRRGGNTDKARALVAAVVDSVPESQRRSA